MDKTKDIRIYALKQLEQIKDSRREFIENLLAAFERDHPEFIEHLKKCGLDEEEIRYCCLEVLGLRMKTYNINLQIDPNRH